ncbi:MAG: succinate dehydrogenase iron-sulfur subunit [Bacteroidota bacterium]
MKLTLRIQRFNPEKDKKPYYQDFTIEETDPRMSLLDMLNEVKWKIDGTLTYRRSCKHGMCGSCGMRINGKNGLACSTLLKDLNTKKPVVLDPLPGMPIIKDLVVDMTDFYKKFEVIKPYLITKSPPPQHERLQSNEDAELLFESAKCILCGCCSSSCPSTWTNDQYMGPAVLLKAYRFVFDTRDEAPDERLDAVDHEDGLWRCHTIFNCVEACPKEINITYHISKLKQRAAEREA